MNYKVLIADDQYYVLDNFRDRLKSHLDIAPTFTNEAAEVIKLVQADPFEYAVVMLDYHFAGQSLTGADVAEALLKINPKLIVLICTGEDRNMDVPISCLKAGVSDFIRKDEPIDDVIAKIRSNCRKFDELSRVVTKNYNKTQRNVENSAWISKLGMVGYSSAMAEVAQKILKLSENGGDNSTVLIRGESGTGKELIAKAIHNNSSRGSKPFISLNCAAVPASLLESELFGHEKGAFTGADKKRLGKFQAASGGTIFLDEIGEMKEELQAKLLRVLQEKTIEPIGSNKTIPVDVRVVAATHANLEEKIEAGTFREDLFYRLNQIPLAIPALRDRPEDIGPLVLHFKDKHPAGKEKKLMYKTLQYLQSYNWAGNVRELENAVGQFLVFTDSDEIRPEHLNAKIFDANQEVAISYSEFRAQLERECEEREKEFLLSRVRAYKSIREAGRALSISYSSLQRKLTDWDYDHGSREVAL